MSRKHFFYSSVFSFVFFLSINGYAQMAPYGSLGLRRIYQSTLINPVLIPDSTAVKNSLSFVPFLPVSPLDFGFNATFSALSLGTLTSAIENKTLNVNKLVNGMNDSKNADAFVGFNMSLFHLYFKVGKKGTRIEVSQRLKTTINTNFINKNLLGALINDGNDLNTTLDMSDSRFRAMSWNEVAFGYTRPINKKWLVGGRLKYLTGIAYSDFSANNMIAKLGADG
ncbi:MAG: hypothetical protein K2Q03_05780, partial [Sphingobacteriaceae bacterium]|nr:hypothetical protein [Sphingobacteriaceae bacterium]